VRQSLVKMPPAPRHRTLIVANRTASTADLLAEVERRAAAGPTEFTLLIPEAAKGKAADWTLEEALVSLRRAASGESHLRTAHVDGRIVDGDPFAAVEQALAQATFDDVIISTLPPRRSAWLRRDLPRKVEALGIPVAVVTQKPGPRIGLEDLPLSGPS